MRKLLLALGALTPFCLQAEYVGDYVVGADNICKVVNFYQPSTGAAFALASGAVDVYKDDSATQDDDSGLTIVQFDGLTGVYQVCVDSSSDGTFYSAGSIFSVLLSAGTVDGVSVAGSEVMTFSLGKGSAFARLGAPAGASIAADLVTIDDFVDTEVAEILVDTSTTLDDFIDTEIATLVTQTSAATLQSEANDAIVANHLNYLFLTTYDPASEPGAADALLNELIESDAGVARFTINALEQGPSGTGSSPAAIADEVQTRTIAAVTTVNGLAANAITAAATAVDFSTEINTGMATSAALDTVDNFVDTEIADILTDTGTTLQGEVDGIQADTEDIQNRLPASLTAGRMVSDMQAISADSVPADRLELLLDQTCGSYPELGVLRGVSCTAQAYTAGTPSLTLDAAAAFGDNTLAGATVLICGTTQGYCQSTTIVSNVLSTDIATLADALAVAATGSPITYTIFGTAQAGATGTPPTVAQIVAGVWDEPTAGNTTAGTFGEQVSTDIDAILVDTGTTLDDFIDTEIASLITQVTAVDDFVDTEVATIVTQTSAATLQNEANDALVANHLDHLLAVDYDPAAKPGVATALLNELVESDAGVSRFTINALEQAPTGAGGGNMTQIEGNDATDVLDARIAAAGLASQLSLDTVDNYVDSEVAAILSAVDTEVGTIVTSTDAILVDTGTTLDDLVDDLETRIGTPTNLLSGATIAANLVDVEGQTDDIGVAGAGLTVLDDAILSAVDAVPTLAEMLDAQTIITGTCDSGSTTTCVDNALTQAAEAQLDDRLACFDDDWCGLITGFTPGTDTLTFTKVAPSTRAGLAYTLFPATVQ